MKSFSAETCGLKVQNPQPWASRRRAPEAMASLQAAHAALWGAQERPEPSDGPGRPMGRSRQTGWRPFSTSCETASYLAHEAASSCPKSAQHASSPTAEARSAKVSGEPGDWRWKGENPQLWGGLSRAPAATASFRAAQAALRVRRSGLSLQMAQGGRWGGVVRQGRRHFQPAGGAKSARSAVSSGAGS